jgi:myo-inositol 2-dehydrogenase/D-chiro-inositol 1-dehydrogenase
LCTRDTLARLVRTRIAIVGAGGVARRHATVLGGFGDVALVGVTDPVADAARSLAQTAQTQAYGDLETLLDATRPDAVYVCVPPFAHGEPERRLLARGIPFFVEKPLASNLVVAEELAEAVARRGLLTATGYHWRYLDGVARAAALLAATPAHLAVAAWLDKVPPVGWWLRRERSGGQVIEQVTHVLDLMVALLGDVREVYAIAAPVTRPAFPDADVDAVTAATLRFASGAVASVSATSLLRTTCRAEVELFCDGRRIVLSETACTVDDGDGDGPVVHADPGHAKERVDRAFVDAVQGWGADVRAPYAVALRTHRVACALARSARDGVPVSVSAAAA